jgi:hypothetical protein
MRHFVHKGILSAIKLAELIGNSKSYITQGHSCDSVVWNVYSPTENTSDDT